MYSTKHALCSGAAAILACLVVASPAAVRAEAPADPLASGANGGNDAQLAPIVVTAERRSANSQDVPISIQTVDGKAIANSGYTSVTDLQYLVPGLQYDPTQGAAFQIRGVGSESFDFSNAKSVSVVVDDVVMDAQRANGLIGLADISRVDVLKGPQGTLFGMNSTSGVIAVTTNRPRLGVTSLQGSASYGEHDDRILNATANIPIGQYAALRVTGFDTAQDGFGRNVTLDRAVGSVHEYGGRARLLIQPSDRFDIMVQGDYAHHWDSSVRTPVSGLSASVTSMLNALGVYPGPKSADTADSSFGQIRAPEWGASVRVHARLGDHDITSTTAYRGSRYDNDTPVDLLPVDQYAYIPFNDGRLKTKKFSEEVHIASPTGQFVEYLGGFFWNRLVSQQTQLQWGTLGTPLYDAAGVPQPTLFAQTGAIGVASNASLFRSRNESIAGFGQVKLNISRRFNIAVGGRYTDDRNSQSLDFIYIDPLPIAGYTPTFVGTRAPPVIPYGEAIGHNFSVRVSPEYHFDANTMAYFTFSTGYKPAGIAFVGNKYDPYNAETVKSYEAGIKSEWLGHRLRINVDAFREDFTNFQTTILTNVPDGLGGFLPATAIGNAGSLRSQGVEANVAVRPTRDLSISGSVTYTDARFTDYVYNATTNYTGSRLTNAPEWAATLSADYKHPLTDALSMRAHADYAYRSHYWTVVGQPAYSYVPGYGLVNARASLLLDKSKIEFGVYARNLLDTYFSTGWQIYGTVGLLHYTSPQARRTVGGFVSFDF